MRINTSNQFSVLNPFDCSTVSVLFFFAFVLSAVRMTKGNYNPEKLDRKIVERNRRIHMKNLCFKLTSLIPPHHFKPSRELLSQPDQVDQAADYIVKIKRRIGELEERKAQAMSNNEGRNDINGDNTSLGLKLPVVDLKEVGSSLQVVLICGLMNKTFMLCEVIRILEDEGAEVLTASFSTMGGKVFHSVHAQVRVSRVGVETSRAYQRLQDLVC